MTVQFILDYFEIDTEHALEVESTEEAITIAMTQIWHNLSKPSEQLLRIRLKTPALFKRFEYFEGVNHVLPTQQLIPRLLLSEKLKILLPEWLSNEYIVALGLLKNSNFENGFDSFEKNLLYACDKALILGTNFTDFIFALRAQPFKFFALLENREIKNHLLAHLEFDLNLSKKTADVLLVSLYETNDVAVFLDTLAYQQHLLYLRQFVLRYKLEIALPALALSSDLATLPLLTLSESEAFNLANHFTDVLNATVRKVFAESLPAEILAELLMVDCSRLWCELNDLIDAHPELISKTLVQKITTFSSVDAIALAEKLKQNTCSLLAKTANIEDVLKWIEDYFKYCRHAFLHKQPLDEAINLSFTHWLLSQTARIAYSKASWLRCSQQITQFLQIPDYAVVVIMVDALSAINKDILLAELECLQQENLTLVSETLFAPLPTLTEIGKLAVLTGKPTSQLPKDHETALRETYQSFLPETQSLKVGRSWHGSANETLNAQTKLLVIFENELDERLHNGSSFQKHRDELVSITQQIKLKIKKLAKDAHYNGREIVFFITADHGMTVTQEFYTGEPLGENKERCFKLKSESIELPEDFVRIDNYAIPKKRLRLTPAAKFTHGGLTPEEVLIPFITLTTKKSSLPKTNIEITLNDKHAQPISDKQWQIDLRLTSNVLANDIQMSIKDALFSGFEKIDSLRANKSQNVVFRFSSKQKQEGLIPIEFVISYQGLTTKEQFTKFLDINFVAP